MDRVVMGNFKTLVYGLLGALLISSGCAALPGTALAPVAAVKVKVKVNVSQWPAPTVTQLATPHPTAILFVGNSYFYYNDSLHNHVSRMAVAAGLFRSSDLTYKSATIGGADLGDHNIDHLLVPANLRVAQPFETVIMAGQSNAALTPARRAVFATTAKDYAAKIRAAGGEPVLYMTPAYVPPHRLARPGMIDDVAALYIETGNDIGALVIPVGLAFAEAYRRRPDIVLHKSFDGSHPSLLGTYLASATTLASLYGISPVFNDYTYFGGIDPADARFLQEVAQDTVTQFFRRAQ